MDKRTSIAAAVSLAVLVLSSQGAQAQITVVRDGEGRKVFINSNAPKPKPVATASSAAKSINPPATTNATATSPAINLDREGTDRIVTEAADRHRVDQALIRAVIQTESGWNPSAVSRKGAAGLMQLLPVTAQRFGVSDVFNPRQNVDAGARYLKVLLDRYNGDLDLALAAYNAGEGAVARHGGVPPFRETRDYVQKVQNQYFRPGSGRLASPWSNSRAIRREVDAQGRTVFTNQ